MKTLKVKSILFSLLAVMAVAVFMTSCEQVSIVEEDLEGLLISEQDNISTLSLDKELEIWLTMTEEQNVIVEPSTLSEISHATIENHLKLFGKEYLFKVNSPLLNEKMLNDFGDLFDKIIGINAHQKANFGYYYAVYGQKNNQNIIEYFKVPKYHFDNQTFPDIQTASLCGPTHGSPTKIYCYYDVHFNCVLETNFPSIRCGQLVASSHCVEW